MTHEERLQRIIVNNLGVLDREVTLDSNLHRDLRCDWLDILGIVMMAEDEFGVEISDDDARSVTTVRDLGLIVDRLTAANASPCSSNRSGEER